jgi:ACS family tartrate transporter-like MFS transporter
MNGNSDALFRRIAWRLVPLILAMYIAAFLNRVNVGFAALTMNKDLGFSPEVYGWGTGIFFLGYLVFEVPSNLIMERVGARLWLSRIMITWALVSMAFAFVQGPVSFFLLRFLLGLAEAGFYPGILLFFTYWFPAAFRARILALFCCGIPLANIVGGPLSGWLLTIEAHNLHGWQWMYLLEGIPTLLLGFVAWWGLADSPAKAKFLTADEKAVVLARLASEEKPQLHAFADMLKDWRVWYLIIPDFTIVFGIYAVGFWMPKMLQAMGYSIPQVSGLVMIPAGVSLLILWGIGMASDRSGKRVLFFCVSALIAAAGMTLAALGPSPLFVIAGFCLACGGVYSGLSTLWTVPPLFLGGSAASGAFALINSVGNLSGFVGPGIMGWLLQKSGNYQSGLLVCAGVALVAAASMALIAGSLQRK